MTETKQAMITLEDGRVFPSFNGEALSWSPGLYQTWTEEQADFPRMRAVLCAMKEHRPDQLELERRTMLRASFDRMFGHQAAKALAVIDQVITLVDNTVRTV